MLTVTPVTISFSYSAFTVLDIVLIVMMTVAMFLLFVVSNDALLPNNCIITNVSFTDVKRIWNSNPYTGQLRIVNETYSNQGCLQVYCYGQWGTVCGDLFGPTHANIACRELGYSDWFNYYYTPTE